MTIRELKNSRNKLLTDAQAILLASPDAEKRTSAKKMLEDADILEADITALEKIEAAQNEERSRTTPARPAPGEIETTDLETRTKNEKLAFKQYIQFGYERVKPELRSYLNMSTYEGRDLTTSSAGQFVPQAFYPILTEALKSYGQVLNFIKTKDEMNGAPMKYSLIDDTGNQLSVLGETNPVQETDPNSISGAIISTDWLTTGIVKISIPELTDSNFDLDQWIRSSFGKRYFRGLSSMVTLGNGSNVASLVTSSYAATTTVSPTVVAWGDLAATYAALDPAYEPNAKWQMNTFTRGVLLATTDSLGRPLYLPAPTAESFDMLLGKQVFINTFLGNADTASNVPILYGDCSYYLLRNVTPGLSLMRLNELFAASGEVGFVGYARSGGALLDAGTHPVIKLTMHS